MLHIVTIVLNGMPFIERHIETFQSLSIPWRWHIVEGASRNTHCTRWCQRIPAGLSTDGTSGYIAKLARETPNVFIYQKPLWDGKIEMVNAPLRDIKESCVLMQLDSDEIWTKDKLELVHEILNEGLIYTQMDFYCRYYVGPKLVIVRGERKSCYGNHAGEWRRAWWFTPGMKFSSHEPPRIDPLRGIHNTLGRDSTGELGLVFDHYAYATEAQVAFKERFYGYKDALLHWKRLQANTVWPARLRNFLPWVKDDAIVDLVP